MASSIPPGLNLDMVPLTEPPRGTLPNFIDPITLEGPLIAVSATMALLAFVLLSIRLYSTIRISRSASYDDAASALAFVFTLGLIALNLNVRGNARHGWDLPLSAFTATFFKIVLCESIFAAIGLWLSKLAIFCLLYRLFSPTRRFRVMVYFGVGWVSMISFTSILVSTILCAPRQGESFDSPIVAARCWRQDIWAVVQGVSGMCLDFYLLYLPLPIVWKLQMERKRKLGVITIFLTGFIACVASTAALSYKIKLLKSRDVLWNTFVVTILNIVELNVANMVACMPACSTFARHFSNRCDFIPFIKSHISSFQSRSTDDSSSNDRIPIANSGISTAATAGPSSNGWPQMGRNQYWQMDNALGFADDKGASPHTTKRFESHTTAFSRRDPDTFDNVRDFLAREEENKKTNRASIELKNF